MPPPAATQAAARLWTARPELHTDPLATKLAECMTPPAGSVRQFTRGRVRELKNGHNSVTVQNRTHVYMNFFHHKDLGNHLLQLCPKVVKHPVYHEDWGKTIITICQVLWYRIQEDSGLQINAEPMHFFATKAIPRSTEDVYSRILQPPDVGYLTLRLLMSYIYIYIWSS